MFAVELLNDGAPNDLSGDIGKTQAPPLAHIISKGCINFQNVKYSKMKEILKRRY